MLIACNFIFKALLECASPAHDCSRLLIIPKWKTIFREPCLSFKSVNKFWSVLLPYYVWRQQLQATKVLSSINLSRASSRIRWVNGTSTNVSRMETGFSKCRFTHRSTSWCSCWPEKEQLNSVATKAVEYTNVKHCKYIR